MSILANALWLLCGLSAAVLAALTGRQWSGRVGLAAGFALAVGAIPAWISLQIEWTGALAVLGAAVLLFRPRYAVFASVAGGALAAILGLLIAGQGIPQTVALAAAAVLVILPALLASVNPKLAGEEIRDEALLGICLSGLAVALTPGIQQGWRSAAVLNVGGSTLNTGRTMPAWALWIAGISLVLGGAHYVWRRQVR